MRIGGLIAIDGSGRRLPAGFELRGARLFETVDDRRARYPERIDPLIQQGPKLTASDEDDPAGMFGSSVALSSDGNTALIGGPQEDGGAGAAWVFTRSSPGVWHQQGSKLTASDESGDAQFGSSVALSSDSNTALIGGKADAGSASGFIGAAWVFTRAGGAWTQQGSKLTAGDEAGTGQFGASVALSADGTTALIGGPGDGATVGAAWVFSESAGRWAQRGSKLRPSDEVGGGQFGDSVALSANGTTALVGGRFDHTDAQNPNGAAWAFTQSQGVWAQQGRKLVANDEAGAGDFGATVALSSDGDTALIGAPLDNEFVGAAWQFARSAGVWRQLGSKLIARDASAGSEFGSTAALSADGTTAAIGGPDDGQAGATWLFAGPLGAIAQQGSKLVPTWAVGQPGSGFAVALSSDGNTALAGGPFDNSRAGAACAFTPPAPSCPNVDASVAAGGGTGTVQLSCTAAPGAVLTYSVVSDPVHGSLGATNLAGGQLTYTSQSGFMGQDSFTYEATDQWVTRPAPRR